MQQYKGPTVIKRKNLDNNKPHQNVNKPNIVDETNSRSESVKNLIEQVQNTLKSIENEKNAEKKCKKDRENARKTWQHQMYEFESNGGEFSRHCPERASTGKIKNTPDPISFSKLHSGTKSVTTLENLVDCERKFSTKRVFFVGSDKSVNEAHKRAFKAAGGKILNRSSKENLIQKAGSNLRIRIKSPIKTDSSNEYETETGIPKSPTLFISGVSISRTPEPCSPASIKDKKSPEHLRKSGNFHSSYPVLNFVSVPEGDPKIFPPKEFEDERFLVSGRQSRSSSLTVPKNATILENQRRKLNKSCGAIPIAKKKTSTPCRLSNNDLSPKDNEGVFNFGICNHKSASRHFFKTIPSSENIGLETKENDEKMEKSQSAAEPEREREVFRFPKSSTDGSLSSVLHIQESNLSSDDFHEALFLLERSPKNGSKRRKRSKKERDKVKDSLPKDDTTVKEASSVL